MTSRPQTAATNKRSPCFALIIAPVTFVKDSLRLSRYPGVTRFSHPAVGRSQSGLDDGNLLGFARYLCRALLRLTFAIGLAGTQLPTLTSSAAEGAGWVSLFDGRTLDGWKQINGTAHYEVRDGAIVGSSVPKSPNSFLCTTRDYADFELEFEVMVDAELNSGVQIRNASKPDYQNGRVHGYQVEIAVGARQDPLIVRWRGLRLRELK